MPALPITLQMRQPAKPAPKPLTYGTYAAPARVVTPPRKSASLPPGTVAAVTKAVQAQKPVSSAAPTAPSAPKPAVSLPPVVVAPTASLPPPAAVPVTLSPAPTQMAPPAITASQGEAVPALPVTIQKVIKAAAAAKSSKPTALLINADWSCDSSNVCTARSARAADFYVELKAAINRHLVAIGVPTIPVTSNIDQATRAVVARLLPDVGSLPHSNLPITPWLFAAKIDALPKNNPGLPSQPIGQKTSGLWWKVGLGAVGVVGAGYFALKRRN